jgi:hypothetical protein
MVREERVTFIQIIASGEKLDDWVVITANAHLYGLYEVTTIAVSLAQTLKAEIPMEVTDP